MPKFKVGDIVLLPVSVDFYGYPVGKVLGVLQGSKRGQYCYKVIQDGQLNPCIYDESTLRVPTQEDIERSGSKGQLSEDEALFESFHDTVEVFTFRK